MFHCPGATGKPKDGVVTDISYNLRQNEQWEANWDEKHEAFVVTLTNPGPAELHVTLVPSRAGLSGKKVKFTVAPPFPAGIRLDEANGTITYDPTEDAPLKTYTITYSAFDQQPVSTKLTFRVKAPNRMVQDSAQAVMELASSAPGRLANLLPKLYTNKNK